MVWIYLSPHLDDAVLSCGGWIWHQVQKGHTVEIWTICAGDPPHQPLSPYARSLHDRWKIEGNTVTQRRTEDLEACALLGARARHFLFPDCIYRKKPGTGEFLVMGDEDLFHPSLPLSERRWISQLVSWLKTALPATYTLVSPLALGGHIDHHLTRAVAEALAPQCLWYYADFPYANRIGVSETALPDSHYHAVDFALSEEAFRMWIQAITCYRSQLSTFWKDLDALHHELNAYYQNNRLSILWKPE
jgi:LmbE family N-acetylglucosaminyl deacetylase